MPVVYKIYGYSIYVWSNENGEPAHFHICKGKQGHNNTKFWILSDGNVVLCHNRSKYPKNDLNKIIRTLNKDHWVQDKIVRMFIRRYGSVHFIND